MERFILRFQGATVAPPDQAGLIRRRVRVVDESGRMLLIEAEQADVDQLMAELPGWKSSKEVQYRSPEPHLSIAKQFKGK